MIDVVPDLNTFFCHTVMYSFNFLTLSLNMSIRKVEDRPREQKPKASDNKPVMNE